MRLLSSLVLLCLSTTLLADTTVFYNVNVIPMDSDRVIADQAVIVHNNAIAHMGNSDDLILNGDDGSELAEGLDKYTGGDDPVLINGQGGYLMPGLAEMHGHIPGDRESARTVLDLFLAYGITTVRGMLGQNWHLELRDALANHEWRGPRLITSGPSFNGSSVHSPEQAAARVKEQAAAGYDFLKLHPGLERDEYIAIVEQAQALDIPFAGHVSSGVGLDLTFESRQATIDHLDGYIGQIDLNWLHGVTALAQKTADAGVWNVPTHALYVHIFGPDSVESMLNRPVMKYVSAQTANGWANRIRRDRSNTADQEARNYMRSRRVMIKSLQENGAGLLLGSDAPQIMNVPGYSTHEELIYLVDAGLTPYQALKTGTANVGEFFADEKVGRLVDGANADLLLLSDNPMVNIRATQSIEGVMLDGRWYDRKTLDSILADVENRKL